MRNKSITILHIASVKNDNFNGVCVAVPQHVYWQGIIARTALINIKSIDIDGADNQLEYKKNILIDDLPQPFNKPDIVVFHEVYHLEYIDLSKQLKNKKIPYVIVPHGCLTNKAQKYKRIKKLIGNALIFKPFINGAVALQCLSAIELSETHFSKKKFIGSNGTNIPQKKKLSFHEDRIIMTFIGRLEPYIKGFDLLFNAISNNKELLEKNNCTLNIYGPETFDWKTQLEKMIDELCINHIVSVNSPVSGLEKEAVLLETDVFIQTSRSEGMPMGILEALSYGVPCFVTEGTTLGGIIEEYDAGFVAKTVEESISDTICSMIERKKDFSHLSNNAVTLIRENYEWSIVSDLTVEKYNEFVRS